MTANYENIERNMCQKEFLAFKACVQQKVSCRWDVARQPCAFDGSFEWQAFVAIAKPSVDSHSAWWAWRQLWLPA